MDNNSFKGFVRLEELGIDTSKYGFLCTPPGDVLYNIYSQSCKSVDRFNFDFSEDYAIGSEISLFTSSGKIGVFRWYALTTYYGKDIYIIDEEKEKQNAIHRETMQSGGFNLGKSINHAMNNLDEFRNLVRDPLVLNTKDIVDTKEYVFHFAMQSHIEAFMDLPHMDVINKEGDVVNYNWALIKDKDLIIPFVVGSQRNIELFAKIASEICGPLKASSAIGLFITRLKPSMDGRDTQIIDMRDRIPVISENPYVTPIV